MNSPSRSYAINPQPKIFSVGKLEEVRLKAGIRCFDMNLIRCCGDSISGSRDVVRVVCQRTFATAAGKVKKAGKGSGANDAPKASSLSKEIKSSRVVGANTLKDGMDPKILADSEYPDCLCKLWALVNSILAHNQNSLEGQDERNGWSFDFSTRMKRIGARFFLYSLWHLLDKRPPLSELRRKNVETLPFDDLKRFVKLDTRARIKENNSIKAKN